MRGRLRLFIAAILGLTGLGLFFLSGAAPSHAADCGDSSEPADAIVMVTDNGFNPASVSLPRTGETVCWSWASTTNSHSVTFKADANLDCSRVPPGQPCPPDSDVRQGSGVQPYLVTFQSPGTYNYYDKANPQFTGTVTVAGTPTTAATTTTTRATTATTAGTTQTTVGTLTPETTTTTSVAGETTTTTAPVTTTTASATVTSSFKGQSAAPKSTSKDEPSGLLKAIGVLLLAAAGAALIPGWRRLT